jgi:hypothetical protein
MAAAWSTGSRGFSASNVASLDTGSITFSGSNKYSRAIASSGAGTPAAVSSVVLDPTGVNQAYTAIEAAVTFNTNFESRPFGLVAPSDISAKIVRSTWASNQDETLLVADFYTGIDQSTTRRTVPSPSQGTGLSPTLGVTSVADDLVIGSVMFGTTNGDLTTISSSQVTIREEIEAADIGPYEMSAQGDVTATTTSTTVGFTSAAGSGPQYVLFGESLIPSGAGPTVHVNPLSGRGGGAAQPVAV